MAEEKLKNENKISLPTKIAGKIFSRIVSLLLRRKKLSMILIVLVIAVLVLNVVRVGKSDAKTAKVKTVSLELNNSFEFQAFNSAGKPAGSKIKFKITTVEKTSQVVVKDQTFTAKNDKLFFIVNLLLKNDSTAPLNIIPGDLVRLSIESDDENKFAPDLHNNVVYISPISSRIDRIGFVIAQDAKKFKLYVGEIEGKKEEIAFQFPY